ncbi:MAG TPA: HAMP domain-containing sensor histidine kinase [Gemmatimonadales bacterium]|nr:HAMP domain-containing sensor histidine kinase [Gemmatimonadales bacterium]
MAETLLPASSSGERRRAAQDVRQPLRAWDPNGPASDTIAPALWDALREAVLWADAEWERVVEHAAGAEEATSHLAHLSAAIRQETSGQSPDLAAVPRNALSRRLLGLIRTAFVERVRALPQADTGQLLKILHAIEVVGQHLESDWSQHFTDRLSAPDGLELVVEVAHDLRSPLTSILFLAETLQRGRSGPVNSVQERQLGLIYSAAFGLSSVASDVIELARGGDRLVDLDPIPFSVRDILESVRDIVQPIAEEKNLTVGVSSPDADFRIGHPVALSRVLLNLTTNALKFTAEGTVEVTAVARNSRCIEFSVRDTGRGIPPQSMATLFEPFRRRHKPGEYTFSGSGLGLSICRKLVEAMGSVLQVETAAGYGTRFYFVLDLPHAGEPQLG